MKFQGGAKNDKEIHTFIPELIESTSTMTKDQEMATKRGKDVNVFITFAIDNQKGCYGYGFILNVNRMQ